MEVEGSGMKVIEPEVREAIVPLSPCQLAQENGRGQSTHDRTGTRPVQMSPALPFTGC
jgi:hypothetical protein